LKKHDKQRNKIKLWTMIRILPSPPLPWNLALASPKAGLNYHCWFGNGAHKWRMMSLHSAQRLTYSPRGHATGNTVHTSTNGVSLNAVASWQNFRYHRLYSKTASILLIRKRSQLALCPILHVVMRQRKYVH
jgi:hypothetical protein